MRDCKIKYNNSELFRIELFLIANHLYGPSYVTIDSAMFHRGLIPERVYEVIRPFSFYVNCLTLPNLFAGKLHALLFRKWNNRVKGRDLYDMEWYIRKSTALNLDHFCQRAIASGDWSEPSISREQLVELLHQKISSVKPVG